MKDFFDRLFSGSGSCRGIAEAFACFTWRDAVDIFLLAALFFAVFRYVRDRRAGRLFWGVGLLLGVYAASELFDFYMLRYVFGSFFGYGIKTLGNWAQSWGPTGTLSPSPSKDAELIRHFTEETRKSQGHP